MSETSLLKKRLELPLLKKRVLLYHRIRDKKNPFTLPEFEAFMASVAQEIDSTSTYKEIDKIRNAIISGEIIDSNGRKLSPDITTPANQLIWASAIAFIKANPNLMEMWPDELKAKKFADTPLWEAITESDRAKNEMSTFARHLDSKMTNDSTEIRWGAPDSWFYFSPDKNVVNLDFMHTLLIGFEHSRSVAYHELGHAELTRGITPEMARIKAEKQAMKDQMKVEKRKATKEEARHYAKLNFEYNLRHRLYNSAEDCCVNRYAVVQGKKSYQDHGPSLNTLETIIQGVGLKADQAKSAGKPGENDKPIEGWGENTKELSAEDKFNKVCGASNLAFFCNNGMFRNTPEEWAEMGIDIDIVNQLGKSSGKTFEDLLDLCDGKTTGTRPHSIGWMQPELYMNRIEKSQGNDYYNNILMKLSAERGNMVDSIWKDYVDELLPELLKEFEENLDKEADKAQNKDDNQEGNDDGLPQDSDGQGNGSGDDSLDSENDDQQSNQDQKGDSGEEQKDGNSSEDGKDNSEDKKDKNKGKSLKDLQDDAKKDEDKKTNKESLKNRLKDAEGDGSAQPLSGMQGREALPVGDWKDYEKSVIQFQAEIAKIRRMFEKVQEHQLRAVAKRSNEKDFLPPDGALARFDKDAHRALLRKKKLGQKVTKDDYKMFNIDKSKHEPTTIDLFVWIDGSGSMMSGDPKLLHSAVQAASILYEATKGLDINTYIGMWGHEKPLIIAAPGDNPKEVGERIAGAYAGLNSGTDMAPSLEKAADILANRKVDPKKPLGKTHILYVSDGDIADKEAAQKNISIMFKECDDITLDVAIINDKKTEMEGVIQEAAEKNKRDKDISVTRGFVPSRFVDDFLGAMVTRIRTQKSFIAKPAAKKKVGMVKALREMQAGNKDKNKTRFINKIVENKQR